ncbi:hypothetical protein [Halovenus aranensis]|uniref:hypothetical protein n=1 Tax=Halovenus aranensis TaxID=890420 RepID=UPI0034A56CA8
MIVTPSPRRTPHSNPERAASAVPVTTPLATSAHCICFGRNSRSAASVMRRYQAMRMTVETRWAHVTTVSYCHLSIPQTSMNGSINTPGSTYHAAPSPAIPARFDLGPAARLRRSETAIVSWMMV